MFKTSVSSSMSKKCAVCGKKTPNSTEYSYVDGISINIPVCRNCEDKTGYCMHLAMDSQLKSIAQFVRMSTLITVDEKKISELRMEGGHE